MEVIKYPYSKYATWFFVILLPGFMLFCLYAIITDSPGDNIWEAMVPVILFFGIMLAYLCRKFFFPLLRGETALELDREKLQFFSSKKVVYWKDVQKTDSWSSKNAAGARFVMEDGSRDIKISTKYVAGKDAAIYDTIVEYFEKYK